MNTGVFASAFKVIVLHNLESSRAAILSSCDPLMSAHVTGEFGSVILGHVESWERHFEDQ